MQALSMNQTQEVVQAMQPILSEVVTNLTQTVDTASYLEDIGFPGLSECGSFKNITKERKTTYSQCACWIVDRIL